MKDQSNSANKNHNRNQGTKPSTLKNQNKGNYKKQNPNRAAKQSDAPMTVRQWLDKEHPGHSRKDALRVGFIINRIWQKRNPGIKPPMVQQQEGEKQYWVCAYPAHFYMTIKRVMRSFYVYKNTCRLREQEKERKGKKHREAHALAAAANGLEPEKNKRKRIVRDKPASVVGSSDVRVVKQLANKVL